MHARMSTLDGLPDEMDEGLRDVKVHVLPQLQQQDGFKGFIALGNRNSGKLIGITFWESDPPVAPPSRHQSTHLPASKRALKTLQRILTTFNGQDVRLGSP
jgi:hypothetical protein